MQNVHIITLVAPVKDGSVSESIEKYLQRGYTIQSAVKYTSYQNGTVAIRFEMKWEASQSRR